MDPYVVARERALDELKFAMQKLLDANLRLAQAQEPLECRCLIAATHHQLDAAIRLLERGGRLFR